MRSAEPVLVDAIRVIRGRRVILDADLAALYGVPTKRMNEQLKRNAHRFPPDFVFRRAYPFFCGRGGLHI